MGAARKQYLNLMTVADATKQMVGDLPGHFTPARLLQAVNSAQKNAKFGSGNDLAELAQWAKKTLPDKIPNSGTAQRQFYQKLLVQSDRHIGVHWRALATARNRPALARKHCWACRWPMVWRGAWRASRLLRQRETLIKRLGGGLFGLGALQYGP